MAKVSGPIGLQSLFLKNTPLLAVTIVLYIVYALIVFWIGAAVIIGIKNIIKGSSISVISTLKEAWKILFKYSLLAVAVFFIDAFGFMLLIIPGVVFAIWFYFAGYIFIDRNFGIKESLSESKRLVEGRFWKVVGRLIVMGIVIGLLTSVVGAIPYLGTIIATFLGPLTVLSSFLLYVELSSSRGSV